MVNRKMYMTYEERSPSFVKVLMNFINKDEIINIMEDIKTKNLFYINEDVLDKIKNNVDTLAFLDYGKSIYYSGGRIYWVIHDIDGILKILEERLCLLLRIETLSKIV